MKNKLLTITLIILVSITLLSIVGLTLWLQVGKNPAKDERPTIDEIIVASVDIPEITTNLASRQFIRISLKIQTDDPKAAEELTKREFQVKNIVIQELSEMTAQSLEGKAGKLAFEETIKSLINPLMQTGEIERVYIVSYIIQ